MLKSKGGSKGSGGPADKKQTILAVVAIVIILGVVGYFAMSFLGGSGGGGDDYTADTSMPSSPMPGAPPPAASTPDASAQPASTPDAPAPAEQPAAEPNAPAPAPKPASAPAPAAETAPTAKMKVFGSVSVTYPASWKIDASVANHAAVFTNGTGSFEIRTPSPQADSAKAIADAALKTYTPNGTVTAQGEDKIAGNDAYWYAVSVGSQTVRLVGVDAPTRVVLLARAPKSAYSNYRSKFDSIQASLAF